MNLKCKVPSDMLEKLSISEADVWYASPYDISDEEGELLEDKGYIVVTKERLFVTKANEVIHNEILSELEEINHKVLNGGGLLYVKKDGLDRIYARFSMKYLEVISYIATGARWLSNGYSDKKVEFNKKDRVCEKCGRGMRTSTCLHCAGRFGTLKRFWSLCSKFKRRVYFISIFMVLSSAISLIAPKIQQQFIDSSLLHKTGDGTDIAIFIAKMAVVLSVLLAVNLIRNWVCATMGAKVSMEIRGKLYVKVQMLSLSFIGRRKPGEIMNRIVNDTTFVRQFIEDVFNNMVTTVITMIGSIIAMLIMSPILTLCATGLLVFVFALNVSFHQHTRRIFRTQRHKEDKTYSKLQDVISGIRVVKVFGKEKEEAEKFYLRVDEYAKIQSKNETFWSVLFPVMVFLVGTGIYIATYFGGMNVLNGKMTPGELMQFIAYTTALFGPIGWMNHLPMMLRRLFTSLERIYDVLDEVPEVQDAENGKFNRIKGDINLNDITFGYESYNPVLEEVSLKIKAGEMIGLVGSSGAGKSTLINLIMRLYDVDRGNLTIDGVDIRDYDKECLHEQIGVVLQESFLFADTIINNIRFAKPEAKEEEVIAAAKAANAHNFIIKTPDGYNTYIGEHGYNISGGQRQRIAIARAILTNPRILILDEATSALDTESEYLIQQALEKLQKNRTTIAIAHRLSTLRKADRLVVIDQHNIAEIGTHNELIEKNGIYANLVKAQLEIQKL